MTSRFYSTGVGLSIILVTISAIIFGSLPASSQSSSCGVSPSSDWDLGEDPRDYLAIDIPGSGGGELFGFDGRSGLRALDKDLSTEWSDGSWEGFPGIQVDNGSATAIELVLMPGKESAGILALVAIVAILGWMILRERSDEELDATEMAKNYDVDEVEAEGGLPGMDQHSPPPQPRYLTSDQRTNRESGYVRPIRTRRK